MRWSLNTFQGLRIREANLMLRIFKKFVDTHDFNFSSSDENNRLFWNYYRLKENFEKKEHWISTRTTLSSNEKCMDVLVEFYLQLTTELEQPLTKNQEKILQKIINRFYDQLKMTSNSSTKQSSKIPFQIGHLGLHG